MKNTFFKVGNNPDEFDRFININQICFVEGVSDFQDEEEADKPWIHVVEITFTSGLIRLYFNDDVYKKFIKALDK